MEDVNRQVEELRAGLEPLYREIATVIIGQRTMVDDPYLRAGRGKQGHIQERRPLRHRKLARKSVFSGD